MLALTPSLSRLITCSFTTMQHHFQKLIALFTWVAVVACSDFSAVERGNVGVVDYTELKKKLSTDALVYFPGSDAFEDATARWSNSSVPVANIIAVPATEQDVVNIVCFYSFQTHSLRSSSLTTLCSGQIRQTVLSPFPCHQWCSWIYHLIGKHEQWY
jgi:hypothetical protein